MAVFAVYAVMTCMLLCGMYKNEQRRDLLDRDTTDTLKAFLCIVVLLYHMNECSVWLFPTQLVFVCVFLFFLFSGYGLTCSLLKLPERGGG